MADDKKKKRSLFTIELKPELRDKLQGLAIDRSAKERKPVTMSDIVRDCIVALLAGTMVSKPAVKETKPPVEEEPEFKYDRKLRQMTFTMTDEAVDAVKATKASSGQDTNQVLNGLIMAGYNASTGSA